ncbi:MAG: SapC family protein, partial [Burkholderiaceae bacterium]|nr:SapC family protein [Burkholderiaceae bacterium]
AQAQLETLESEIQRTRAVCKRFQELDLLQDMRFDVTLPDGSKHTVDGFMTLDDKKATALPDDVVAELHRSGLLGLMHLHWVSMGNMRRLVDWHVERSAAEPAAVPAAPTA